MFAFRRFHAVAQLRTTLVIDADPCSSVDCAPVIVSLWTRKRLWRPERHDIPPVRSRHDDIADMLIKSFGRWLGQNSKQNKLSRALGDVQIRMRLKVSGDKSEIRLSYLPAMFPLIVAPLMDQGSVRLSLTCLSVADGE